ncbi:hypothetical protein [Consotaella salsifontis]|uniref:GcrA cell cycle regulator n=1 Tax=Consotaella salsifontis TaxID=1365950 RepID=A0A1T4SYV3_9HYPH|nr:hypothetical protein [Consotaella salsifontis]SKA33410.1 hypothetical protein SAMN05428963_11614 [Consotaella salsifontis]
MNQLIQTWELASGQPVSPPSSAHRVAFARVGSFACRFILDEPGASATCCGAPTDGKSWCRYHQRIVFEPKKPRLR